MKQGASGEYLRNAVLTATPEQLNLMLFDGAIRFARHAQEAMGRRDWETLCEKLLRVQQIVLELQNGLRPEINPQLCEQMSGLYTFVYRRLVDANIQHNEAALGEAIQILEHMRETWRLLVERLRTELADRGAASQPEASEAVRPGASLSVEG